MFLNEQSAIGDSQSAIIIGGGIGGLTAAYHLSRQPLTNSFLLLEAKNRFGGTIESVSQNGFLLESGADSFLSQKTVALNLIRKLNIENELISTNDRNRRAFLVRGQRLCAIPKNFQLIAPGDLPAFFASDILSSHGKMRLANERFLPAAAATADETLADFVRRRFGSEALSRVAQPMLAGIYTADPEKLSMAATQPRFLELEQKYGSVITGLEAEAARQPVQTEDASGARYGLFVSFKRGMQTLIDALTADLPAEKIRLNTKVEALRFDEPKRVWRIVTNAGETLTTKTVCLALPAAASARLLENQFPALARELAGIEHASTATVNFGFRREQIFHPLDGFGFVVPFVERRTLIAATFSSVKFSRRAPDDHVLIRAFVGGALQPDKFALDDEAMTAGALADLRALLGVTGKPVFARVARWADSMPQYHVGHLARVERIKELLGEIPGLQMATNASGGVGVPDVIRAGERAAENLISSQTKNG